MGEVAVGEPTNLRAFETLESNVRLYSRSLPDVFSRARGSIMTTDGDRKVIDFFCGAGALNYGHNNDEIKAAITKYLSSDAVVHGLDMATPAKREFMETLNSVILRERGLQNYRFQFTGPTGANAVEARPVIFSANPAACLCLARHSCPMTAIWGHESIPLTTCGKYCWMRAVALIPQPQSSSKLCRGKGESMWLARNGCNHFRL